MKVGLFGGSFDPVHQGHLRPVIETASELGLERVIYLPTASPPHKRGRAQAPALLRYAMVELAVLPYPDLLVSSFELDRDRSCYTIDTLEHFSRLEPDWDLHLLIGADSWADIHRWHRWREILAGYPVAVLARRGWPAPHEEHAEPEVREAARTARLHFSGARPVDVSSSELRERLARGEEVREDQIPRPVVELLRKYRPYS